MTGDEVVIGVEARAFNATIRNKRRALGLTQRQLAEIADVSFTVVSGLETMRRPRIDAAAHRVLTVLGLDETASPPWLAALELHGTRYIETTVNAELLAAPERLALPMFSEAATIQEADDPEQIVAHTLDLEEMRDAMHKLPERQRRVLEWVHDDELTYEEIARSFGISRERVRQIKNEAENALCAILGQPAIHKTK